MTAYYNENDPFVAKWLRNLIEAGHVAPGIVDDRSIEDVRPSDLSGFTQCHFFAGIGVWSYALRLAGWPDSRPVWTGSCPCQPFSSAGEGAGFADKRHLWPSWFHLISQCQPSDVLGEQVASKDANPWIDLVQNDMEAMGYPFAAVAFPSAGVGAPHIRDRIFWVAHANNQGLERRFESERERKIELFVGSNGLASELGNPDSVGTGWIRGGLRGSINQEDGQHGTNNVDAPSATDESGPTNGFWRDVDWLACRDGKWRPVESGAFPLAHGSTSRVGRLRAYGNAINAQAAKIFIESVM